MAATRKKLEIIVTGRRYVHPVGFIPITEKTLVTVTGSQLSIRKAESEAVNKFLDKTKTGSCGLQSRIL